MKSFSRKRLATHPRVLWRRTVREWPLLVWLAVIAAVVVIYRRGERFGLITGVVETVAESIAPIETARLLEIDLKPGDAVKAGQTVARMDTTFVDADSAVVEAQMAREVDTFIGAQQNVLQSVRRAEDAVRDAEAGVEDLRMRQSQDAALLDELRKEQTRRDALLAKQLIDEQDANALRPQIASLAAAAEAYPRLIALQDRRLAENRADLDDVRRWLNVEAGAPASETVRRRFTARTDAIRAEQDRCRIRREQYALKASRDGVVSRILLRPGDVVPAGTPIVRIVSPSSNRIYGFIPEPRPAYHLHVGDTALVWRRAHGDRKFRAVVTAIEPEFDPLPGRVSPIQGQPLRGRRVVVDLLEPHDLVPGETVQLSGWAGMRWPWERWMR